MIGDGPARRWPRRFGATAAAQPLGAHGAARRRRVLLARRHPAPRLTVRAGFELGTGVDINVYPPERAAADLRLVLDG